MDKDAFVRALMNSPNMATQPGPLPTAPVAVNPFNYAPKMQDRLPAGYSMAQPDISRAAPNIGAPILPSALEHLPPLPTTMASK